MSVVTVKPVVILEPVALAGYDLREDLVNSQVNMQPDRTDPLVTGRAEMF